MPEGPKVRRYKCFLLKMSGFDTNNNFTTPISSTQQDTPLPAYSLRNWNSIMAPFTHRSSQQSCRLSSQGSQQEMPHPHTFSCQVQGEYHNGSLCKVTSPIKNKVSLLHNIGRPQPLPTALHTALHYTLPYTTPLPPLHHYTTPLHLYTTTPLHHYTTTPLPALH